MVGDVSSSLMMLSETFSFSITLGVYDGLYLYPRCIGENENNSAV
jgi:hypothetical protein